VVVRDLDRRELLTRGLGLVFGAPLLTAAAGPSDLRVAQLTTKGTWNTRPNAMRRLLWEVTQRTSIEVQLEVATVAPSSKDIFRYPFLYWSGAGAQPAFTDEEVKRLRRHLTYGGTLLVDSADADPGGAFDTSVRRELARILPRASLERVAPDHVVYKSFYLVETQAGRTIRLPYTEGIQLEKRYAVLYSQNDLAGAWARDAFGRWEYEVTPGGERQREMAFRFGINIVMYALCLDYKDDLVHAPFILKRRR
jgi:hypothetical protein